MARKKLGEVLIEAGLIDELQLEAALSHQRSWGGPLGRILIDSRFITEEKLVETLSQQMGVPRVELAAREIPAKLLEEVPLELAEKLSLVPVALRAEAKGEVLYIAMTDPTNLDAIDTLQFRTGKRVMPMIATESEVEGAIRRYYYGERPREVTTTALENVQFVGRDVNVGPRPSPAIDDIPVVTGSTLIEPDAGSAAQAADPGNDPDWFLQMDAEPEPAPAAAPAVPPTGSPFSAAGRVPPPASAAGDEDPAAAKARGALFGAPNSFLGRDDEIGLGQGDPRQAAKALALATGVAEAAVEPPAAPAEEQATADAPSPPPEAAEVTAAAERAERAQELAAEPEQPAQEQAQEPEPEPAAEQAEPAQEQAPEPEQRTEEPAPPTAEPLPDAEPAPPAPRPREVTEPLSIDEYDDTPLELATAAEFLHGGAPAGEEERGVDLDDFDDDAPLELATAADMIQHPPALALVSAPAVSDEEPPEAQPSEPATAAELAQLELAPPPTHADGEGGGDDGAALADLSEIGEVALARLEEIDVPDAEVLPDEALEEPSAEVAPVPAATRGTAADGEPAASAAAPAAPVSSSVRPLPPAGGVTADDPDDADDGPIQVVNMPPDRKPVGFVPVAPIERREPEPRDEFGNPLGDAPEPEAMEALELDGGVFDADSGEQPAAPLTAPAATLAPVPAPAPTAGVDAEGTSAEVAAASTTNGAAHLSVEEPDGGSEPEAADAASSVDPLTSHAILEMERQHGGTTSLSSAGLVDAPERVAGERAQGEVMTLALPTPAFSHASVVDAPWRLEGQQPPPGRGPADVPLAPLGLASSSLSQVDDVAQLAPAGAAHAAVSAPAVDEAPVALPGAAPASLDEAPSPDPFTLPDTIPVDALEIDLDEPDDDAAAGQSLISSWREAAEMQLHTTRATEDLEVPEHRRVLEPPPQVSVEAKRPLVAYQPAAPSGATALSRPPWAVLVDVAAQAQAAQAEPPDEAPAQASLAETAVSAPKTPLVPAQEAAAPEPEPAMAQGAAADPPPAAPTPLADDAAPSEPRQSAVPEPVLEREALAPKAAPPPEVAAVANSDASDVALREPPSPSLPRAAVRSKPAGGDHLPRAGNSAVALPAATPRSVLVAAAVQLDDDLTPESSPPTALPSDTGFELTPTMITKMSPEQLRVLAERLLQRGALTADDVDAARGARQPADPDDDTP